MVFPGATSPYLSFLLQQKSVEFEMQENTYVHVKAKQQQASSGSDGCTCASGIYVLDIDINLDALEAATVLWLEMFQDNSIAKGNQPKSSIQDEPK